MFSVGVGGDRTLVTDFLGPARTPVPTPVLRVPPGRLANPFLGGFCRAVGSAGLEATAARHSWCCRERQKIGGSHHGTSIVTVGRPFSA
jgi:hypothetical protein